MGKKSATKVEAAPAAIKATKPLKKGKREPEDDLDTKVNLKKQKKDLVAAVQKEKAEKKVPKKVESSDEESDSSDSEEEDKAKKVPAKKAPVKAASSSDDSDDSSSDDEPAQKKAVASTNGTVAKKAKDESSSEEESSDEEEVAATKKPAAAKPAVKDSSSSEDDDDSEDESEDEKPAAKKAAPVATKAASSSDESDEDSEEESEDEKPAPKGKEATKTATKDSSSDDSGSDESESEGEEETPKKKSSDVEMVDAEKKQPKTPSTPATGGSNTLFVANLPFQVERSDVEEFFKEAGQVVDVRFAMSKDDGSFRGFGHVEFASAAEAQKALEFHGRPLLGRELRLDVAQERGERPAYTPQSGSGNFRSGGGGAEVFVKGFDSSLPVNDIKSALSQHFAPCGEITRVSVPIDRETGGSRGIAYLEFKEGTEKAFELNGSDMGGWNLVVDEPRPKENNNSGGFNSGRSSYGGGRDNVRGRGRGRGRDNFRGRGRGRENGRGRPSFTPTNKKTTFSDE
ncbi:hypothetical protein N665_0739s0003 [Sinapis alba]|nr:hypothetical protein N665_0739s0003 [Sinapis alba]